MSSRIIRLVTLGLAATFLWAAGSKLIRPMYGVGTKTLYEQYAPRGSAAEFGIIAAEILLAVWLLSGLLQRGAAIVAVATLSTFPALGMLELKSESLQSCGCGGFAVAVDNPADVRRELNLSIARNVVLLGAARSVFL